jgi:outer membrane protein
MKNNSTIAGLHDLVSCFIILSRAALLGTFMTAPSAQGLTLEDAERIAIQNHPKIHAAQDVAAAAGQMVRQARSAYYPAANGSLSSAVAEHGSRIAAGGLNNSIIFDRYSNGVMVNQLVTDFGRTRELVTSSSLHARAEEENIVMARADVLLQVNQSYYEVLEAQAVLRVAEETVKDRQLISDQVAALSVNNLRSDMDVSFANVDLAQAKLSLMQAQNDLQISYADFSAALGYSDVRNFQLAEPDASASPPPADEVALIQEALGNRPELISQRFRVSSAKRYATAERDLSLPAISAVGAAGLTPAHQAELSPRYAALGFNVNIPLFNGNLYGARRSEADAQARAQEEYFRAEQIEIVRDVQRAWLNANSGYLRLELTNELLAHASKALDLARGRYKLGFSEIVALSQAQLNKTQAEVAQVRARYDYLKELATLAYESGQIR